MKLYKAMISALASIGLAVCIFIGYGFTAKPSMLSVKDFGLALLISVFIIWIVNKVFYRQALNGEVPICPWCGGITPQGEDINFRGTRFDAITSLTLDGMGKFLLDWGLACVKGEEPKDVFKWLEEQAER